MATTKTAKPATKAAAPKAMAAKVAEEPKEKVRIGPVAKGEIQPMPSGGLRAAVLEHLQKTKAELSPSHIGKALGGRSAGEVFLAAEKLVEQGAVRRTSEKPRRYQAIAKKATALAKGPAKKTSASA